MLNVIIRGYCIAEWFYAKCHYTGFIAEWCYAGCYSAEYGYAKCM
jgi:hypothetical protein